jgi:hypothetical protein
MPERIEFQSDFWPRVNLQIMRPGKLQGAVLGDLLAPRQIIFLLVSISLVDDRDYIRFYDVSTPSDNFICAGNSSWRDRQTVMERKIHQNHG